MTDTALRLLRPLVRAASFVAPATAGKVAFRLFCTPPRRSARSENGKCGATSAIGRLARAEATAIPFPCGSVQAYVFDPADAGRRGTVLLVHGWSSEAAFMTAFATSLCEAGFRVVAFDLPAHGASTGRVLDMPLGVASLAAVARTFGPFHAIVTHSFGGAIALAALAGAITGILIYLADDNELRDLTFWSMGSLAGSNWDKAVLGLPFILPVLLFAPLLGGGLNALSLGEAAARHIGHPVERIKLLSVLGVAAAVGAATAIAGGIGFVGIVVPHLLRLATGPDHTRLLPNAAILGAALLVGADTLARLVVAPAELPIGIITAILGAPVFLWILLRQAPFAEA